MALRIHLPWGWLLTALGYAVLAAGAAWLHSVDYDGHLYTQLALHAVGGLILGSLAWAFSERVAYAANLNTKPALRLILAGVLASYAAAWVASPYTEFTAGAHSVVAPFVAVGLYRGRRHSSTGSGARALVISRDAVRGPARWRRSRRPR